VAGCSTRIGRKIVGVIVSPETHPVLLNPECITQ
jgi:hypothetical protein